MANEQRDMSGVVFRNEKKTKDTHPSYTGQCMIDGKEYWMDAWVKDGRSGKFFSFSFKSKEQRQEPARQTKASFSQDLDDDIPFAPEFR